MSTDIQPRDTAGRFGRTTRPPEVSLSVPGDLAPGDRVTYRNAPGYRVVEITGDTLTLRPPKGGVAIAMAAEVTPNLETPAQQSANLAVEAHIARLLASVKRLSRQRRDDLNAPTGDAERAALDALAVLYADGRMSAEQYVYVMRSTEDAPLAANHACLAITMRQHLSAEHYAVLTSAVRRAGGVLPD